MNNKKICFTIAEARELKWKLLDFSDRLENDSKYYKKKAKEISKMIKEKNKTDL